MDLSIALTNELTRNLEADDKTEVITRYLRVLVQHRFITKNEANSLALIPYRGVVEQRFLDKLLYDFSSCKHSLYCVRFKHADSNDSSVGEDAERENKEEELNLRMFTRTLRILILALLDMFEDWTHRAVIFREFIDTLKQIWPITKREYELAFYHDGIVYNTMNGRDLIFCLSKISEEAIGLNSNQFINKIYELIEKNRTLATFVDITHFDVSMMRTLVPPSIRDTGVRQRMLS